MINTHYNCSSRSVIIGRITIIYYLAYVSTGIVGIYPHHNLFSCIHVLLSFGSNSWWNSLFSLFRSRWFGLRNSRHLHRLNMLSHRSRLWTISSTFLTSYFVLFLARHSQRLSSTNSLESLEVWSFKLRSTDVNYL